jgi:hypothetical protein
MANWTGKSFAHRALAGHQDCQAANAREHRVDRADQKAVRDNRLVNHRGPDRDEDLRDLVNRDHAVRDVQAAPAQARIPWLPPIRNAWSTTRWNLMQTKTENSVVKNC